MRTCGLARALTGALVLAALLPFASALAEDKAKPAPEPAADADDDTVAPDRPDFSNGTGTMPLGVAQLELGVEWRHRPGPTDRVALQGALRVGLPGPFELRLEGEQFVRDAAPGGAPSGFGDLYAGFKARILEPQGYWPGLAVQPFVKLPTAAEGLGSGLVDFGASIIVSQPLPAGFAVDVNIVPAFFGQEPAPEGEGGYREALILSGSFGHAIGQSVNAFVEPVWVQSTEAKGHDSFYLGGGAIFTVHQRLALDAAVYYFNTTDGGASVLVRTGLTIRAF